MYLVCVDCMLVHADGSVSRTLGELLPQAARADLLGSDNFDGARQMAHDVPADAFAVNNDDDGDVVGAAISAASASYTPFTGVPAGVGIRFSCGTVVSGSVIESVAFNPSMTPLQSALVMALVHGVESLSSVSRVALVQNTKSEHASGVCYASSTEAAVAALNPDAKVTVLEY